MNLIKKFGTHLVAALLLIGAAAFYFVVVRKVSAARAERLSTLESRRNELKGFEKDTPCPAAIAAAEEAAKLERRQIQISKEFLANQPRLCHTREFFRSEDFTHPDYGKPIVGEVTWRAAYQILVERLRDQVYQANLDINWIDDFSTQWGSSIPSPEQMQEARECYWFQRDLAELLTDSIEVHFKRLMADLAVQDPSYPKDPAGLVINNNPNLLEDLQRNLGSDQLRTCLEAMLFNPDQLDLASLCDKYLSSEKEDADFSWKRVLNLSTSDAQRAFMARILPAGQPDLSDHQRFVDYVMDLRSVRYRADMFALLHRHKDTQDLARSLDRIHTPEVRERVRDELKQWSRTRLAQAIANIIFIQDNDGYELVRDNHKLRLARVEGITIQRPALAVPDMEAGAGGREFGGGRGFGGPREMPSPTRGMGMMRGEMAAAETPSEVEGMAKVTRFSLRIMIEFERLPVFLRRFLSTSWHYTVVVRSISPAVRSEGFSSGGGDFAQPRDMGLPGVGGRPGGRPSLRPSAPSTRPGGVRPGPTAPVRPEPDLAGPDRPAAPEEETIEGRKYVWVDLDCQAFQYTLLLDELRKAGSAAANMSGGTQ